MNKGAVIPFTPVAGAMSLLALAMALRGISNPSLWIVVPAWTAFALSLFFLGAVAFNRPRMLYGRVGTYAIWPIVLVAALVGVVASVVMDLSNTRAVFFWPVFILGFVWLFYWLADIVMRARKK